MGRSTGRHGGGRKIRRPASASAARQHSPYTTRLEGPAGNSGRWRLPIGQRPPAGGIQAVRQSAAGAHADCGRPLRRHRHRASARKPRGLLHRFRALHPDRRRSAGSGDFLGHQHARRIAPRCRICLRLRAQERAQEGHDRAQGQCAEGAVGNFSRYRARGCREVRGQSGGGRSDHRCLRDAVGAEAVAVRCDPDHQSVR